MSQQVKGQLPLPVLYLFILCAKWILLGNHGNLADQRPLITDYFLCGYSQPKILPNSYISHSPRALTYKLSSCEILTVFSTKWNMGQFLPIALNTTEVVYLIFTSFKHIRLSVVMFSLVPSLRKWSYSLVALFRHWLTLAVVLFYLAPEGSVYISFSTYWMFQLWPPGRPINDSTSRLKELH